MKLLIYCPDPQVNERKSKFYTSLILGTMVLLFLLVGTVTGAINLSTIFVMALVLVIVWLDRTMAKKALALQPDQIKQAWIHGLIYNAVLLALFAGLNLRNPKALLIVIAFDVIRLAYNTIRYKQFLNA